MSERKRILIVGGNGFVGINLAKDLSQHHHVTCTHGHSFTRLPGVDYIAFRALADKDLARKVVQAVEPDLVIYTVGSNDIMTAEKDVRLAQHHHTTGATQMQAASEFSKAKFVYLSSDTVFSGHGGNFNDHDTAIPSTTLGKSKLATENHIRGRCLNYLIIRAGLFLGRGTLEHPSWVDRLRESDLLKKKIAVNDLLVRNPVHMHALSEVIMKCIENDVRNRTLHIGGLTKLSEQALAEKVLKALGLSTESIVTPNHGPGVHEPHDYSLNFTQTLQLLKLKPYTLDESLSKLNS